MDSLSRGVCVFALPLPMLEVGTYKVVGAGLEALKGDGQPLTDVDDPSGRPKAGRRDVFAANVDADFRLRVSVGVVLVGVGVVVDDAVRRREEARPLLTLPVRRYRRFTATHLQRRQAERPQRHIRRGLRQQRLRRLANINGGPVSC